MSNEKQFVQLNTPFSNYGISEDGFITNFTNGNTFRPTYMSKAGYIQTNLFMENGKNRTVNVHSLLARTFVENPDPVNKKDVMFKDGNRKNCVASNLIWATRKELIAHYQKLGAYDYYKPVIVTEIATGIKTICKSTREASKLFNIHSAQVDGCLAGKYKTARGYTIEYIDKDQERKSQADFIDLSKFSKYVVSEQGDIYVAATNQKIATQIDERLGYERVILINDEGKRVALWVHRLVASRFVYNPDLKNKRYINHKDHNKLNNHYTNLEWTTLQENNIHSKLDDLQEAA